MSKMVDVGRKVLIEEARSVAAMLSGGFVILCDGMIVGPDRDPQPANVMARLSFTSVSHDGTDVIVRGLHGNTERKGKLRWFRACDPSGATVLQGLIGLNEDGKEATAPMMVSRIEVLPGDRVDMAKAVYSVQREVR